MATFNYAEIPAGVQTVIKNLQEIVGGDISDEEVYAVLRDCGMDPNAAVEQLLAQDPFQEVKRKKDKKKRNENANNRKLVETRSRVAEKGSNDSTATYACRNVSNDASDKNNDIDRTGGKATVGSRLKIQQINESSSIALFANSPHVHSGSTGVEGAPSPSPVLKKDSEEVSVCSSPSNSVLLPSEESQVPEKIGVKKEVSSRRSSLEANATTIVDSGDQLHPMSSVPRVRFIFPRNVHVPESIRLGLTFGSFGAAFQPSSVLGIERSSIQQSTSYQVTKGQVEDNSRTVPEF